MAELIPLQDIVNRHFVMVGQSDEMVDGNLLHAAFVFGILLLRGVLQQPNLFLCQVCIFPQISQTSLFIHKTLPTLL